MLCVTVRVRAISSRSSPRFATSRIRFLVFSPILPLPDSARETVHYDTPISFAISSSVIKIPCHFLLNLKNSYIFIFNTNAVRNQVIPQSFLNHHLISKRRNGRAGASGRPARPFPVLFYCFIFLLSPLHTLLPDGSSHPEYPGFRRCP